MKGILEVIELALFTSLIIGMFFIFGGDPDIYDTWQDDIKGNCIQVKVGK